MDILLSGVVSYWRSYLKMSNTARRLLRRFFILLFFSTLLVFSMSELVYLLQRENTSRGPRIVELIIPVGTGESLARGEDFFTLPEEMVFVVGDKLVVDNQDTVEHRLGPLWIPPKATASLKLSESDDYTYSCSFSSSKYLGLTVRKPVTWKSRLNALWYGVPPTLMFLLVYSFAVRPINVQE